MRPDEVNYWDGIAKARDGKVFDNIWKRLEIVSRISKFDLIGKHVLEIGCGMATAFAALRVVTLGHIDYVGTDLSPQYCKEVGDIFGMRVVQTDIQRIPVDTGVFDYCFCLDSLEHVRPEDRNAGYKEISRVLKPKASIVLNIPLDESQHDSAFDHGFDDSDLFALLSVTGMRLYSYETYQIKMTDHLRHCAWAVGVRE
jgi:SAM-dependent methyltransferase